MQADGVAGEVDEDSRSAGGRQGDVAFPVAVAIDDLERHDRARSAWGDAAGPEGVAAGIERRDRVARGEDDLAPAVGVEIHSFGMRHYAACVSLPERFVLV